MTKSNVNCFFFCVLCNILAWRWPTWAENKPSKRSCVVGLFDVFIMPKHNSMSTLKIVLNQCLGLSHLVRSCILRHFNIVLVSKNRLFKVSLSFMFPPQPQHLFPFSPIHVTCVSSWVLNNHNNIRWAVQITKLLLRNFL